MHNLHFFNILFRQTSFHRDFFNQITVAAWNAQLNCNLFTDGTATAAKLAADCNDPVRSALTFFGCLRVLCQLCGNGFFETLVQNHRNQTRQCIRDCLHPHKSRYPKPCIQNETQRRKDNSQAKHRQEQRGFPFSDCLKNGVIHIKQTHANHTP